MADADWCLEYLGIEALDRLVVPLQIVEIERPVL
jgi:hypothetical protein